MTARMPPHVTFRNSACMNIAAASMFKFSAANESGGRCSEALSNLACLQKMLLIMRILQTGNLDLFAA
jgi:hypothetical protein